MFSKSCNYRNSEKWMKHFFYLHCRTQKNVLALVCWRFHVTRLPIVTYFRYDTSTVKNINLVETNYNLWIPKYLLMCLNPSLKKYITLLYSIYWYYGCFYTNFVKISDVTTNVMYKLQMFSFAYEKCRF